MRELERALDHRGEILDTVLIRIDVGEPRELHHARGEHPVGITRLRLHEAVGREEDGRGHAVELAALVLPRGAEVALELGMALE